MKRLPLAMSSLFFAAVSLAQPVSIDELEALEGAADEPQIRRYQVEVIIFAYAEDVGTGSEIFVPELLHDDIEEPDGAAETDEDAVETEPLPEPEEEDEEPVRFEFELIGEDAYTLTEARERLERLDAYQPLMHFGWIQGMFPDAPTPALPVERFAAPPPGLTGTLNLYLSRYLHLVVDLSLAAEGEAPPNEPASPAFGDARIGGDWDPVEARYAPLAYRIVEDRILKNGETRYYDHPKFGVIARVLRIEDEEQPVPDSVAVR